MSQIRTRGLLAIAPAIVAVLALAACGNSPSAAGPVLVSASQAATNSQPPPASTASTRPTLTVPSLSAMPASYAPGVEFTIDPSDKSDPQDSSEVDGFNWWPGFGPHGSLGAVRWVAVDADGAVYAQDWDLNGNAGDLLELSCNGPDEIEREFSDGGRKSVAFSIGDITGDCPDITPWNYTVSQVKSNDWTYNVVK